MLGSLATSIKKPSTSLPTLTSASSDTARPTTTARGARRTDALGRPRAPVPAGTRRAVVVVVGAHCQRHRRRRRGGVAQGELVEDGRHGVHVVQRLGHARQRRDQEVADGGLLELPRHPPHQLRPGRGGRAEDVRRLEELEEEAAGDGVPLRRDQAHDLLEEEAVPRGDLLDAGIAAVAAIAGPVERLVGADDDPVLGDVGQPPARVRLERVADGLLVDGAGGLDGHHDAPEQVNPELGDVVRPPRRRRRGVRREGGGARDERRDGVHAPGGEADVLAERRAVARRVEHGERVLPSPEEAGGEERVELGGEVAAVGGLRHAEVRRGAAERDEVPRAHRDGDAVAELGARVERLDAAREPRELDHVAAIAAASGLGAQRLQKQAFRQQRKLSKTNSKQTSSTNPSISKQSKHASKSKIPLKFTI